MGGGNRDDGYSQGKLYVLRVRIGYSSGLGPPFRLI